MKITVKPKILIVENQPESLTAMERRLARAGFDVVGARTGAEGIRLASNEEFDLILLDADLPDQSGFEVCVWLKQDFRFDRTPILFVRDHWTEDDRRRALDLGAADLLSGPFDTRDFAKKVISHLKSTRWKP